MSTTCAGTCTRTVYMYMYIWSRFKDGEIEPQSG